MTDLINNSNQQQQQQQALELPLVLQDLHSFLCTDHHYESATNHDHPNEISIFATTAMAVPVAAIKALLGVVQRSKSETMMGLQDELNQAANLIVSAHLNNKMSSNKKTTTNNDDNDIGGSTNIHDTLFYYRSSQQIALKSGCELFLKYVTRTFLELANFEECRLNVLERGERFSMISQAARYRIAVTGADFVPSSSCATILTHGASRVVASILLEAKQRGQKQFNLIILEGRPDAAGVKAAKYYSSETNIPVTIILDSAMGYIMEQIDLVLIGAEGVMENGGIINKIGTTALCACAKAYGKPVYVAVESYKFARLYPLGQHDLPIQYDDDEEVELDFVDTTTTRRKQEDNKQTKVDAACNPTEGGGGEDVQSSTVQEECASSLSIDESYVVVPNMIEYDKEKIQIQNPAVDFTPAKFITLLFTDLGVLTPSAVSDELIRLYQ